MNFSGWEALICNAPFGMLLVAATQALEPSNTLYFTFVRCLDICSVRRSEFCGKLADIWLSVEIEVLTTIRKVTLLRNAP